MKFLNYFQLVLCIVIFVSVIALIIKNISIDNIGPMGILFATALFILTGMLVLYAWGEIRNYDKNERTLGGRNERR